MKTSNKLLIGFLGLFVVLSLSFLIGARTNVIKIEPLEGNGNMGEALREYESFRGFSSNDDMVVNFVKGDSYTVLIRMDENVIDSFETWLDNGWLVLNVPSREIKSYTKAEVTVTAPRIEGFVARDRSIIRIDSTVKMDKLNIGTRGYGQIEADLDVTTLDIYARDRGKITLSGQAVLSEVFLEGSVELDATDLTSQTAVLESRHDSQIKMGVAQTLIGSTRNGGLIRYQAPENLLLKINGNKDAVQPL